jgi:hypothetical protein
MYLPAEITRIIYSFLGFFPVQQTGLIPLDKIQHFIQTTVRWRDFGKRNNFFFNGCGIYYMVNITTEKYYLLDYVNDMIILRSSSFYYSWKIIDNSWQPSVQFFD